MMDEGGHLGVSSIKSYGNMKSAFGRIQSPQCLVYVVQRRHFHLCFQPACKLDTKRERHMLMQGSQVNIIFTTDE